MASPPPAKRARLDADAGTSTAPSESKPEPAVADPPRPSVVHQVAVPRGAPPPDARMLAATPPEGTEPALEFEFTLDPFQVSRPALPGGLGPSSPS